MSEANIVSQLVQMAPLESVEVFIDVHHVCNDDSCPSSQFETMRDAIVHEFESLPLYQVRNAEDLAAMNSCHSLEAILLGWVFYDGAFSYVDWFGRRFLHPGMSVTVELTQYLGMWLLCLQLYSWCLCCLCCRL